MSLDIDTLFQEYKGSKTHLTMVNFYDYHDDNCANALNGESYIDPIDLSIDICEYIESQLASDPHWLENYAS